MSNAKSILVIGYGNPARNDDGLGPALAQRLSDAPPRLSGTHFEAWWDYQLSVEFAADAADHDIVIFVDASVNAAPPFEFAPVDARGPRSISSHALAPAGVVGLARETLGWRGTAYVLAIPGCVFDDFTETLSAEALARLGAAEAALRHALEIDSLDQLAATHSHTPAHATAEPVVTP